MVHQFVQVRHHPRTLGKSKYGLGRVFRVLIDLTTICFLQRFREKPMHLMGFLGGLCVMGSMVAAVFTTWSLANMAQIWGYGMAIANAGPGFAFSVQLLIMGFQVLDLFPPRACIWYPKFLIHEPGCSFANLFMHSYESGL
jgi:hypothetical protein